MKGGHDESMKPMDPLFPRLHVHDADKGGPKPPPRNKIALCEEYTNAASQSPRLNSGSLKMPPTPQPSSSPNGSPHQRSFHLAEKDHSYHSTSSNSMPVNKNDFIFSSDGQPRTSRSHGNLQLQLDREKFTNLNSISLPELLHARERDQYNKTSKLSQDTEICSKKPVEKILANSVSVPLARIIVEKDNSAQKITRKRRASEMDISLHSKIEKMNELSEYEERGPSRGENDDLTPDGVVDMIGQRLFWKARNTILRQQRTFALQKFELHRLIKVQRLIAGSPEVLHENNFNLKKPPNDKHCGARAIKDAQKESSTPKSSNNPEIGPWCFHPPDNQWLIPVKSPSEGLFYKPFVGPFPPPVGIMAPVFGNCGPINFGGTAFGQSYIQPYAMPMPPVNFPSSLNLETDHTTQFDCGGSEMQGISGSSDQNVQVIKVVPHINPTLAQESAARIFQSIQQERSKT